MARPSAAAHLVHSARRRHIHVLPSAQESYQRRRAHPCRWRRGQLSSWSGRRIRRPQRDHTEAGCRRRRGAESRSAEVRRDSVGDGVGEGASWTMGRKLLTGDWLIGDRVARYWPDTWPLRYRAVGGGGRDLFGGGARRVSPQRATLPQVVGARATCAGFVCGLANALRHHRAAVAARGVAEPFCPPAWAADSC